MLLADKLLAKRPGHRPALRAKGAALGVLADIDRRELRFTDALALSRAGLRVQQELTGLDPGNSSSQNNLRVAKWDVFSGVGELGHINEGIASAQAALVIDKVEILSGFSLRNLVPWHSFMASDYAEYGRMGEAQADLAKAEKYLKSFMAVNTAKGAVTALQADLAMARARIDLANNKPDNVEADLAKHIAARLGHCAELGKDAPTGQDGTLADLYLTTADALLMKGDIVNAAAFAQKALLEWERSRDGVADNERGLAYQRTIIGARTRLAIALAKQGKQYDAAKVIEPAMTFAALPAVQKSEGVLLKADLANALYAAALAKPENKKALLTQAARLLDGLTADVKASKRWAKLRADVAAEMKR